MRSPRPPTRSYRCYACPPRGSPVAGEAGDDSFFFSSRRRHTRYIGDWSSDVCSSDLEIQRKIRDRGSYPSVMAPEELDALNEEDGSVDRRFTLEMTRGLDRWLDMADGKLRGGEIPCILNGGNDDIWEIDDILEQSPCVSFAESKVLDIGGFYLASMGWTNPTPWNTFREAPEDVLATKIEAVASQIPDMSRAVFNFHAPPYGTGLDEAPALDANMRPVLGGAAMKPVGSTAVRAAILKYEPVL